MAQELCGSPGRSGVCRNLRKVVEYGDSRWHLSACRVHLDENERAIPYLVDEVGKKREEARQLLVQVLELRRALDIRKDSIDRLSADLRRKRNEGQPAFMGWLDEPSPLLLAPVNLGELHVWHQGRCALCGEVGPTVVDHDHWSGLVRGFLCHDCNRFEGNERILREGPIGAYRQLHPARWFSLRIEYHRRRMWRDESAKVVRYIP